MSASSGSEAKLKDVTTPALPSPTARPRPVVMCGDRSELDIVLGAIEARGWTDEYGDIPEGDVEEDEEGADCRNVEWWRQRFASERAWQQRWVARCCAIALGTMTPPPAAEDDDVRFIRQCHLVGQDALRRLPHEEGAIWRHIDRQYWRLTNISVPSLANKLAMRERRRAAASAWSDPTFAADAFAGRTVGPDAFLPPLQPPALSALLIRDVHTDASSHAQAAILN